MSELEIPESWAEITLGELGTTSIGLTYSPQDVGSTGVPVLRSNNIKDGKINFNNLVRVNKQIRPNLFVEKGDILICARNGSRALVGKAAQIKELPERMAFGAFMAIYKSHFNGYVEKFLNSQMFRKLIDNVGTATINQITQENIKQIVLPLPPLAEQHRIVAKIESTHSKIAAIEKAVTEAEALLKKYRESLLAKAFRGELVPQDPNDEPASKLLERIRAERAKAIKKGEIKKSKNDELPPISDDEIPFEIPKSWEWVRLVQVCRSIVDGDHQAPPQVSAGVPFLVISNIRSGKIDFSDTRCVPNDYFERLSEERKPAKGNLLYTVTGSYGIPVLVGAEDSFCFQRHIALIKPIEGVLVDYLLYFLGCPIATKQADACATGSAQKTVPIVGLRHFLLPFPPLAEQRRILCHLVRLLDGGNDAAATLRALKVTAEALRSSISQFAFSGRLVPQDPSEGTGHELLAQILKDKPSESTTKETKKQNAAKAPKK